MSGWESTYKYAVSLFEKSKDYADITAKSKTLKQAWNAANGLPNYFEGRDELMRDIENYAYRCGINLDEISGY